MTLKKDFEPHLSDGDTTVTGRDIEMLRAIDQCGSMHKAANELGRSYPHLQRRVVELEDAIGQLTRRDRGGKGGGGTQLTTEALELIREFERLRVELTGVTTVPETVMRGTVAERYGELATIKTAAGDITARVPTMADEVEIAVRADAVVLMNPQSPPHIHTSLRNQISGVVSRVVIDDAIAIVTVEIADDVTIQSMVTEESVDHLDLEEGMEVIAAFKTTAARATATEF
ncbi:MAG: TOBE domain-containing protein [Halobacteriales archaeon]